MTSETERETRLKELRRFQMSVPVVCCIMLTRNRPEMARRAMRSLYMQTYRPKSLRIVDTSDETVAFTGLFTGLTGSRTICKPGPSIGMLRNKAIESEPTADVIAHWDDDDWSSPSRLAEQVALLQSSGADLVGYREVLFWRQQEKQAWLYSGRHAPVGTSFVYWRRVWEQHRFPDLPVPGNPLSPAEDTVWAHGLRVETVSSLAADGEPRMIAAIHEGNTQKHTEMACRGTGVCREFTPAPRWNEYCERNMRL